jgi:hypothetical protein
MLALGWVSLAAMVIVVTAALVIDGIPQDVPAT